MSDETPPPPHQLDVKEAVIRARRHFRDLLGEGIVTLEEIEEAADGDWLITLGHGDSPFLPGATNKYKVLKIDRTTGDLVSMKIRPMR